MKIEFTKIEKNHVLEEMYLLALRYDIRNFLETGTHIGECVVYMATKNYFDKILSVELSARFLKNFKDQFSILSSTYKVDLSKVSLYQGDSSKKLPEMLLEIEDRAVFWLDAHYSGGENRSSSADCTIMKELEAIKKHHIRDHVIVIDDMSYCDVGYSDYPSIEEIKNMIYSINRNYLITIKYDALFAEVPTSVRKISEKNLEKAKHKLGI